MTPPTLADPAARVIRHCRKCGEPLVTQKDWATYPELRELGYLRHSGFGLCARDYGLADRAGTLPLPAPGPTKPRLPTVELQVTYAVTCADCGEVTTVPDRRTSRRIIREHRDTHRHKTEEPC